MYQAHRVDLNGLHGVALAVRQGRDARNVIHNIELFFFKQLGQGFAVADVHAADFGAEIVVVKL